MQLAHMQNLANAGNRSAVNHHQYSEKMSDDNIFSSAASPPPPTGHQFNNLQHQSSEC